jgi:hypothetical protein
MTDINSINNLKRADNFPVEEMLVYCTDLTRPNYPHEKIYGQYCTLEAYIDCPPEYVFEYLSQTGSLGEWTYSLKGMQETEEKGLYAFQEMLAPQTQLYCRTYAHKASMTVDYHCAWDQGKHLWMIYLMRVIPAQLVFNKPGSVVFWSNCHHPFYDQNPYPEIAPKQRPNWVGDFWDLFYAGHTMEMENLKTILEYRHKNKIPNPKFKA